MIFFYLIAIFQATFTVTICALIIHSMRKSAFGERRRVPTHAIWLLVSYALLSLRIISVIYLKESVIDFLEFPVVAFSSTVITIIAFGCGDWALYKAAYAMLEKRVR